MRGAKFKPVYLLDSKGNYIAIYSHIGELAKQLDVSVNTAKTAIKRGTRLQRKYYLSHVFPVSRRLAKAKKSTNTKIARS